MLLFYFTFIDCLSSAINVVDNINNRVVDANDFWEVLLVFIRFFYIVLFY